MHIEKEIKGRIEIEKWKGTIEREKKEKTENITSKGLYDFPFALNFNLFRFLDFSAH